MEIHQYLRVLRAHWRLIVSIVAVFTLAGTVYGLTREPTYAAKTQFFVSTRGLPAGQAPSQTYQGGLFSEARVPSYATLVTSLEVAQAVTRRLGLDENPRDVQNAITAKVPEGTVLIDVTVEESSAEQAKSIADGLGAEFPRYVDTVEAATPSGASPVNINVTEPAELPTSPETHPELVYPVLGLVLGLLFGVGAAVLRETFDKRIRYDDTAEAIVDAPVIGHIVRDRKANSRPLVVIDDAGTRAAEGYRQLRTNLRVLTIDRERRSVLITSAVPGEGKTLVSANLAFAFAEAGHQVVLVDADMRRSGLTRLLGLAQTPGLSDVLAGKLPADPLHRERDLPLEVLTSGSARPNANELLDSQRFADLLAKLTERADIVIVDSPALLAVSDAAVMARLTSAVVMVARSTSTRADEFHAAAESLQVVGKQPIGVVLNGLSQSGRGYGYEGDHPIESSEPRVPAWE